MNDPHDSTVRRLAEWLERSEIDLFVGSGLSSIAGLDNWDELIAPIAAEIGLTDLVSDPSLAAQFFVNESSGNRIRLEEHVRSRLGKPRKPSELHLRLTKWPLSTIWTTNYDELLEAALKMNSKQPRIVYSDEAFRPLGAPRTPMLIKIHGSVDPACKELVLTRDDYESYERSHPHMSARLAAHLVERHFVFVGFGCRDPHLVDVFGRIRSLMGSSRASHIALMRARKRASATERRFDELFLRDLERYGIHPELFDDQQELEAIVSHVSETMYSSNVFLSGSDREGDLKELSTSLGVEFTKAGLQLHTGLGDGVGREAYDAACSVLSGAGLFSRETRPVATKIPHRFQENESAAEALRAELIDRCRYCVVVHGAEGTMREAQIASQIGCIVIPLYWTGGTAQKLWDEMRASLDPRVVNELTKISGLASPVQQAVAVIQLVLNLSRKHRRDA